MLQSLMVPLDSSGFAEQALRVSSMATILL